MTSEHLELIRAFYVSKGPADLAREIGVTPHTITRAANAMGLTTRKRPGKVTEESLAQIRERYVAEGPSQLAIDLDLSWDRVVKLANKMGLKSTAGRAAWGKTRAEKNSSCNLHFFETWSAKMAYVLGFIFADGNINQACTTLSLGVHHQDGDIIYKIASAMGVKRKPVLMQPDCKSRNNAPQVRLAVNSVKICESLIQLNCHPRKTYRDDPFPAVPEEYLPHFLRGAFDGDGCISRSARAR